MGCFKEKCVLIILLTVGIHGDFVGCKQQYRHRQHHRREATNLTPNRSSKTPERFKLWADGPNFDTDLPQDVTAIKGQTAYLTCRVFEGRNKTVSWIRHRDLHILTVGRYTYTADLRYKSIYNHVNDEWTLQIASVQKRDEGRYECQISTQPVRSFFVKLSVLDTIPNHNMLHFGNEQTSGLYTRQDPKANILGDDEVHVSVGSELNLTCVVKSTHEPSAFILWYHGDNTIDYSSPRGGIEVKTRRHNHGYPSSTLIIENVGPHDSGKYTCDPSNARSASVSVHVSNGEKPEAIHTNASIQNQTNLLFQNFLLILDLYFLIFH
ncbi:peroxidasin homolog [Lepeophtheirus salmonis]|uniref:peroxidasin homolog n=1 Tax=Lepeophtheirus salmonis TaxID=72036 RepID=UPI003AF39B74